MARADASRSTRRRGALARFGLSAMALAVVAVLVWPRPDAGTSAPTWTALVAPLAIGRAVANGYVLESMGRGEEHDLVLVARRAASSAAPGGIIEMHVVDRGQWSGVLETASFGVAFEAPRSTAPVRDSVAACRVLADVLRRRDGGGLGPVDAVALSPADARVPAPWIARTLWRIAGPRGIGVGLGLVVVTWLLAWTRRRPVAASVWLAVVGLFLRAPVLGLPFDRDQDVQRLFTGHLPVVEILTGAGLQDRHPPLYFLVLHAVEWLGQSEAVARAPAVLAGALVGPAVMMGVWVVRRRAGPGAALVALAATLSVELVRRSRECSEIPLFGLVIVAACACLVRAFAEPSPRWRRALSGSFALALWTYYLAPLVLAGSLAGAWLARCRKRSTWRAAGLGVLLGAPALWLEGATLVRDAGARAAADAFPRLAWGHHGVAEMAGELAHVVVDALAPSLLVALGVLVAAACVRRHPAVLVPVAAFAVSFAGIALAAPIARVQPYYVDAVLPLVALAGAASVPGGRAGLACAGVLGAVIATVGVPRLRHADALYASSEAVFPVIADAVDRQPEARVVVTVDYDTTILAYYLARRRGVPLDWDGIEHGPSGAITLAGLPQTLVPLVRAHSPGADPEGDALRTLQEETSQGHALVVARHGVGLERLDARLGLCHRLTPAGAVELLRCGADDSGAAGAQSP